MNIDIDINININIYINILYIYDSINDTVLVKHRNTNTYLFLYYSTNRKCAKIRVEPEEWTCSSCCKSRKGQKDCAKTV